MFNKERKRIYRRKQRRNKELRLKETWRGNLRRSEEIVKEERQGHSPMDRTEVEWDLNKLSLFRKGQKFVLAPKRIDTVVKFNHFYEF